MCYDYARMLKDIEMLTDNYNIIERFSIGKSVMQKDIPCLKIGRGKKKLLLSGAFFDKICVKLHRKADDGNGIFRV